MILKGVGGMRAKSKWIMTGLFLGIMIITAGTELSASGGSYSSTGNIVVRKAGADGRTEKLIEIYSEDIQYLRSEIEGLKK
ncbi:MAG: hypothetical protein HFI95_10425 [Lachnospiraceae bacterium]|jgi:hypothetical protein|nr:hypothetical protein [Lachnospiraceae bacterium]